VGLLLSWYWIYSRAEPSITG